MRSLDQITHTLGKPKALWSIQRGTLTVAAIARWRHGGGTIAFRDADAYQVIFNLSGGHRVNRSRSSGPERPIRTGSIGVNVPKDLERVDVSGRADTLQILLSQDWVEAEHGDVTGVRLTQPVASEIQLRSLATQALVALEQGSSERDVLLEGVTRAVADRFADLARPSRKTMRGGLSPGAYRRVSGLITESLANASWPASPVDQMAKAAGVSVPHFIRAFRRTEGQTPYASVLSRRLDAALLMLLRTEARLEQVSAETGFSSASHFISSFRRHTGVTPGSLREAVRSRA